LLHHAVGVGFCEIRYAADKALEQRLSLNMSAISPFRAEQQGKNTKFFFCERKMVQKSLL
jgi:hypothetical protein